ncbi:MAG: methyltransferase domain protein [Sphingomonas bacterium]|uniref:class I SAM-dependent methyltransferase n=1 Tax=Sphingomonas bacterium TaxID=1895847 RepID=UPI00260608E2|nr:class I SAM-dependent methyltransferase [Sphingomonas bacterium]MDB5712141.1 methyltransferase domain protein [Sphingomonas bacterium]
MGPVDYDSELQRHNAVLRRTWDIGPRDRVLDIGCGAGQTTCDAARLASTGSALGVDISAPMIERARERADAQELGNVAFLCGDAALHPFPAQAFDVVISRFGTMFFADRVAALANIARAMRHGGRLTMMVWQPVESNEWAMAIRRALATAMPVAPPPALAAFSLGDPALAEQTLDAAGLVDVTFTDVNEPVYYGANVAAALDWVCGFSTTSTALQAMAPADRERALDTLRETLAAHDTGHGVWLGSRAWIVTARRP